MGKKKLSFKKEFASSIVNGSKTSTVRLSTNLRVGEEVEVVAGGVRLGIAKIKGVEVKKVKELTEEDAHTDGFSSKEDLIKTLRRLYRGKNINDYTEIKLIRFELKKRDLNSS